MIDSKKKAVPTMEPVANDLSNKDIDRILRGEFSAIQSYEQVIKKFDEDPKLMKLHKFQEDHTKAAQFWKTEAKIKGKIPENESGAWGSVVEAFVGASKLMGKTAALKALKNGEEHGLKTYEEMLESDNLTETQKSKISNTFIPMQKEHIHTIENLEKST